MPVANDQLDEIIDIVIAELGDNGVNKFRSILIQFQGTAAYRKNKSFQETVIRLLKATR